MSFTPIPERSDATPELWNSRFEELQSSISQIIGTNVRDFGAVGNGATDDTVALQAAFAAAHAAAVVGLGVSIFIPRGNYLYTTGLSLTEDRIRIVGEGRNISTLTFAPATPGLVALTIGSGSALQFENAVTGISIQGPNAIQKVGLRFVDTSGLVLRDVTVSFFGGTDSVGFESQGRELTLMDTVAASGVDRCLLISPNPNHAIDSDHLHVTNAYFFSNSSTRPCVEVTAGVNVSNLLFDGYQSWALGAGGFRWVDTGTVITANNLRFVNVRREQAESTTAYCFHIDHNVAAQNISIENAEIGPGERGFFFRRSRYITLARVLYDDVALEALNADSTCQAIALLGCFWNTGSTATTTGLIETWRGYRSGVGEPLPQLGFFTTHSNDVTFGVDVQATGGFRQTIDGFNQDNVAASQTNVELARAVGRFRAVRAGSVTGVSVTSTEARTAGTCTVTVFRNTGLAGAAGSTIGLTAVLDGTNTSRAATTQAKDTDTLAMGDELYLTVTTDGGWLPVTADIRCVIEIED